MMIDMVGTWPIGARFRFQEWEEDIVQVTEVLALDDGVWEVYGPLVNDRLMRLRSFDRALKEGRALEMIGPEYE